MIVNEIISQYRNILKNKCKIPKVLIQYMKDNGFELLGQGGFSDVYAKPNSNFVIKIGHKDIKYDGYMDYVNFIKNNPGNKYLPKVGNVRYYENENNIQYYVLPIEKLYKIEPKERIIKIINMIRIIANNSDIHELIYGYDFDPLLISTVKNIINEFGIDMFDAHGGNIMQRRNGDIVLNDVVGSNE